MAEYGVSIKIDPAKMLSVARTLDAQRSIIENNFNSIFQDANRLKSSWEGNSADAYYPLMEKLASIQNAQSTATVIVNALKEYVLDLNSIAAQFANAEQQNTSKVAALPGDVFGV